MSYKQTISNHSRTKFSLANLQPAQAWIAILGFVFLSALLISIGAGKILNLAFPTGAFAVGILLYFRYPILYIGFALWLWFLTPLVRRLVDYQSGFTNPSPILLAPYLVTLITLITFWQYFPRIYRQDGLPFILPFAGVFYALLIGLVQMPIVTVGIALLDWLAPLVFGFHLFVHWQDYPSYRQNIQRAFLWGVLVMGVYGIVQYLVAPEWDTFWLQKTSFTSGGNPELLGIRVWSTLNSPGPFADVMKVGLLLLFSNKGALTLPAAASGYLAFLLSTVRSAWGGWLVGVLTFAASLKAKLQMRFIIIIMVVAILVIPLTFIEQFSDPITSRFETFSDLENDGSATVRREYFQLLLWPALTSFIGKGIGDRFYDNGIFVFLFNLGWLGTLLYLGGLLMLCLNLFQGSESRFDPFVAAARAIVISSIAQLLFGSAVVGVSGVLLWGFLGIGMAARKYYRHQHMTSLSSIHY